MLSPKVVTFEEWRAQLSKRNTWERMEPGDRCPEQ